MALPPLLSRGCLFAGVSVEDLSNGCMTPQLLGLFQHSLAALQSQQAAEHHMQHQNQHQRLLQHQSQPQQAQPQQQVEHPAA